MKKEFEQEHNQAETISGLKEKIAGLDKKIKELEEANLDLQRTKAGLKDSAAKYQAIVKAFDGMIMICSNDYRIEFMNQKYIEWLGSDYTGQKCFNAIHGLDDVCPVCSMEQVLKGETVRRITRSKRDNRWYYMVNTPIYRADGSISKQSLILDIHEQKKAEEALKVQRDRAQKYLDIAGVMFIALDDNGVITLINKMGCQILGYEEYEILGKNWFDIFIPEAIRASVKGVYAKLMAGEELVAEYFENPILNKKGEERLIAWHNTILRNESGAISGTLSSGEDITERRLAEKALLESEGKFRSLVETTSDWVWEVNSEGVYTYASPRVEDLLGYSPEEIIGKAPFDLMPPEEAKRVRRDFHNFVTGKKAFSSYENINIRKDGRKIILETSGIPVLDETGSLIGYRGIDRDITERKKSEEALVRSLQMAADIIREIPVGFFIYDYNRAMDSLTLSDANPEAGRLTGIESGTWRGKDFDEIWPRARKEGITDFFLNVMKSGRTYDTEDLYYKDERLEGAYRIRAFRIPGNRLAVAFEDITDRKKIENALKESEERFRLIFEQAGAGVTLMTIDGQMITANPAFQRMLGYSTDELRRMHISEYSHPDDYKVDERNLADLKNNRINEYNIEKRYLRKNGDPVWTILTVSAIKDSAGKIKYVVGIIEDITERKKSEEKLKKAYDEIEKLKDRLQLEKIYLQEEIQSEHGFHEIIGQDKSLRESLHKVEQVANTDSTVLILGETGTGKELFARAIHNLSDRRGRALVKVNCSALPANLIESELFGHERGAFTGAIARKIGRFELADGGSIFLDEIGDLPLELQAKLLRVLQESEFERVGSPKTIKIDVRVIAATNRDLTRAIASGAFRDDLYHRLNVFPIRIPPLRERRNDIPLLVRHFVAKYSRKIGKEIDHIPKYVIDRLVEYDWPGNIRGLENIIERAVIISRGNTLEVGEWFSEKFTGDEENRLASLEDNEKNHILRALKITNWRVSGENGAARILKIKPTTLEAKMKKLGIKRPS